ncbi:MAG: hypothetical protein WBX01_01790 [Nitrososphaeraceae archaeon]
MASPPSDDDADVDVKEAEAGNGTMAGGVTNQTANVNITGANSIS